MPRLLRLTPGLLRRPTASGAHVPDSSVAPWLRVSVATKTHRAICNKLLDVDYQRYLKPKTNEFTVYGRYTYPRTSELGWTMLLTTVGSKAKS